MIALTTDFELEKYEKNFCQFVADIFIMKDQ